MRSLDGEFLINRFAYHPISTLEKNKQLLLRWFDEVWNQGRQETILELFPDGILHDGSAQLSGPD